MKKTYIKPATSVYDIETESIIAQSPGINTTSDFNVDNGQEGSREDNTNNPSTPNLWEQGW